MTINHLNLVLSDVPKGITFFETYFGFSCTHVKGVHQLAILKNTADFTLVLMAQKEAISYPKAFHIGWILDSTAAVDRLYQQLTGDGLTIAHPPRYIRDSYSFYFYFDALFIEVSHYLDVA
ncbi:VOC family protein [Niabella beijingensis]|uniref:VOC family protein n=1 Tax=Niabella beijingensis TaxID=2872700 RepID=UPI001CBD910B|nr:VOC family protein [Niabella beijingensis]MBZ4189127.1 VOC family protein [Niabella beijingensis]